MSIDKLERNNRRLDAATQSGPGDPETAIGDARGTEAASRRYAEGLTMRFQDYVEWAISNWPIAEPAPDQACFERSRQDLIALCRKAGANMDTDPAVPGSAQFVPVTPMPWP